ncbi:neurochondrin isoform X2 [Rhodamnia argentea]|uniref:Neurochondrin isoform X2 n=1 Tax=Rhodamnia argentea TaxID=178133 RepID=A0A8B8PHB8_9MYRT|nr:neurochondrin isoform X2 [Rhodamnia argentea]
MEAAPDQQSPSLDDCLKLLKGERDEQRLAGLLLVTKFCKGDDLTSLRRIYDAVGTQFLDRLLRTGMGQGSTDGSDNHDAYLQLSVTVLAAFCRVIEIAASNDMVSKIPLILEILSNKSGSSILEECYEFLYLVLSANEDGVVSFFESRGLKVLAPQMSTFSDGSRPMELAMKLVQLLLGKLSLGFISNACLEELSIIVAAIARQFAVLHNALKFEALHILSAIFSSELSASLHEALRVMPNGIWSDNLRIGITAILQNRVAPADKLHALILAESAVSIMGEKWFINQVNLPDAREPIPVDRCLLLVLESSRVEIAVLLNDVAYLKYEASKSSSSSNVDSILSKQRTLAIAFSLIEKIIRLVANMAADEGDLIDEDTFTKVIHGLNETIGVVLEYLQDAKEHGEKKGDDLLASVRVVGSYLAETPVACKEKVQELLPFMLSIEGNDEPSPFYSVCFLLPMLCQTTMKTEGCQVLASFGGDKAVVDCLIKMIGTHSYKVEDTDSIFLACDTIMNLLLKKEKVPLSLKDPIYINLLRTLVSWAENTDDPTVTMMASSICSLILDHSSEEALLGYPNFSRSDLHSLCRLIVKSLASNETDMVDEARADLDLQEIISSGFSRWSHRFPYIQGTVERELGHRM